MRTLIVELFKVQKNLAQHPAGSPERATIVERLSRQVPAAILAHFLRFVEQGRPGVSLVRHGVCSECHIRVPFGMAATLAKSEDLHLCEHCGAYLLLPDEEMPVPTAAMTPTARRVGRPRRNLNPQPI
jgi:predicted  nucleic acid-binding Zn-ribbon protein